MSTVNRVTVEFSPKNIEFMAEGQMFACRTLTDFFEVPIDRPFEFVISSKRPENTRNAIPIEVSEELSEIKLVRSSDDPDGRVIIDTYYCFAEACRLTGAKKVYDEKRETNYQRVWVWCEVDNEELYTPTAAELEEISMEVYSAYKRIVALKRSNPEYDEIAAIEAQIDGYLSGRP